MLKKESGASLAQYGILIGILILGLIPIFWSQGQIIKTQLQNFLDALQGTSIATVPGTPPGTPSADPVDPGLPTGPLGGTPAVPVRDCDGDTCTIDFGSFTLNGIKDDYAGFVETAGTAGGVDEVANILNVIADAVDADPDLDIDSELIRNLSNTGHDVANSSSAIEDKLDDMKANPDSLLSLDSLIFDMGLSFGDINGFEDAVTAVETGLPEGTQKEQNIKDLVLFLASQIDDTGTTFSVKVSNFYYSYSDPASVTPTAEQIDTLLDLNASDYMDLDSQIICVTGDGTDPGHHCSP